MSLQRSVFSQSILLFLVLLLSLTNLTLPAVAATGTPLREGTGLYPRVLRLSNGVVVASVVTFEGNRGIAAIYRSTDDGGSFTQIGNIADPAASEGRGLCCGSLFELSGRVGDLPAGTLLWAASVGQNAPDRRMSLRVWRSPDQGRTWSYLSTCRVAPNTGGLWEPELSVDASGRLVCHYADETRGGQHSQLLARVSSTDGVTWSAPVDTIALAVQGERPGMPVVRRMPDRSYSMLYEVCGVPGQFDCAARFRTSADGWNWGDARDIGPVVRTQDGGYLAHAPTFSWSDNGTARGRLIAVGQQLRRADGSTSPESGRALLVNTEGGHGNWFTIPAPVQVADPPNNYCPNYSSTLLPSRDGQRVLEIATDYDGGVCKPYHATGSAVGTGGADGLAPGRTYRFINVHSGHCLDVAADSRLPGGNIQQWTCNNLGPQNFRVDSVAPGVFTLTGANSGHCVEVTGQSTVAGADVIQWTCNGVPGQRWRASNVGNGYYTLTNVNSGQCLDVVAGSQAPGADVAQWHCNRLAPQIWKAEQR
ncbi:RICIN domain-containing protein [Allokutzneria sp. NRRL B-24872]|uniref:RICIN domain-containing protein n=1 Tax=Allokutzneria sp. NRRL B-24872 TaxID=1137961 RepID=UPI001AEF67A4|nr:RICIN domain-containing protein [Allokutzneria sp. NRRL B-24872]